MRGKNLKGQEFGLLEVKELSDKNLYETNHRAWLCECVCGNETLVVTHHLTSGQVSSCGCVTNHGMTGTSFHKKWQFVKNRVKEKEELSIDEDWKNYFITFKEDMYEDYENFKNYTDENNPYLLIDRNETHYCKENTEWVTRNEIYKDIYNDRNRILEFKGEKRSVKGWAKELGINLNTLLGRLNRGFSAEEALNGERKEKPKSIGKDDEFELYGEQYTLVELSDKHDIKLETLVDRLRNPNFESIEEVIEKPVMNGG